MDDHDAATKLADAVGHMFWEDPGTLPEVQLLGLAPEEAQRALELLRSCGKHCVPNAEAWDLAEDKELSVADTPQLGKLAAEGRVNLHLVITSVQWDGAGLPDLGISIWEECLSLDYRPGPEWTPSTIACFVGLVDALQRLTDHGRVVVADPGGSPYRDHEQARWKAAVARYYADVAPDAG